MSHFAQLDENNLVIQVLKMNNEMLNEGYDWLVANLGGSWIKTSYNTYGGTHQLGGTPFRKNFAAVGYTYDEQRDAFIPPSPFPSWVLDEETCWYVPPIPYIADKQGKIYDWDEESLSWVIVGDQVEL